MARVEESGIGSRRCSSSPICGEISANPMAKRIRVSSDHSGLHQSVGNERENVASTFSDWAGQGTKDGQHTVLPSPEAASLTYGTLVEEVRQRHRIIKRVAEHKKKTKKAGKKDVTWKSKIKKDPGIPSLFPYKGKLLAEIEERKRTEQEQKQKQREDAKAANKAARAAGASSNGAHDDDDDDDDDEMELEDTAGTTGSTIADFAASIASRQAKYSGEPEEDEEQDLMEDEDEDEDDDEDDEDASNGEEEWSGFDGKTADESSLKKETSRKMFDKDFKSVVEDSDVILYVLDARDPEGTRSREVEKMVLNAARGEKRLILVLNKIDLVPKHILNAWLEHLRLSFPTLPLKATSSIASHTFNHKNLTLQATSAALLKSLKSYAQKRALKRSLTIGIIGFPNVGKSSVINALLSRTNRGKDGPCPTGSEAGVTRSIKELKLDGKVKLLDSPGIVFPATQHKQGKGGKSNVVDEQARLVLMNSIPSNQIVDPLPAATLILHRLSATPALYDKMMALYNLPPFVNDGTTKGATEFLIHVARKRGRLGKGGIPDVESAARAVVTDWCEGRLQWYTPPPPPPHQPSDVSVASRGRGSVQQGPSRGQHPTRGSAGAAGVASGGGGGGRGGSGGEKEIVNAWAAEFNLEDLYSAERDDDEEAEAGAGAGVEDGDTMQS